MANLNVKAPKFEGEGNVKAWTDIVLQLCQASKVDPAHHHLVAATHLKGKALEWFNSLSTTPTDWKSFYEAICSRFSGSVGVVATHSKLSTLTLNKNETPTQLLQRLEAIVSSCNSKLDDITLKQYFRKALMCYSPAFATLPVDVKTMSINNITAMANDLYSNLPSDQNNNNNYNNNNNSNTSYSNSTFRSKWCEHHNRWGNHNTDDCRDKPGSTPPRSSQSFLPRRSNRSPTTCYKCNQQGHIAKYCTKGKPSPTEQTEIMLVNKQSNNITEKHCKRCNSNTHDDSQCFFKDDETFRNYIKNLENKYTKLIQ